MDEYGVAGARKRAVFQRVLYHWGRDFGDSVHSQDGTGEETGTFTLSIEPVVHAERALPDRGTSHRKGRNTVHLGPTSRVVRAIGMSSGGIA